MTDGDIPGVRDQGRIGAVGAGQGGASSNIPQEIRVPGGETLYDRELRLQRLKTRAVA